tara:strand:- start:539 stop:784 length:246 start_codon:yes stop_codon:yes gene_type:complete
MKPDKCHHHDLKWADELISTLPPKLQLKVCFAYCEAYQEAFDSEPSEIKKEGAARREANTRLRLFVERHNKPKKSDWTFTS